AAGPERRIRAEIEPAGLGSRSGRYMAGAAPDRPRDERLDISGERDRGAGLAVGVVAGPHDLGANGRRQHTRREDREPEPAEHDARGHGLPSSKWSCRSRVVVTANCSTLGIAPVIGERTNRSRALVKGSFTGHL